MQRLSERRTRAPKRGKAPKGAAEQRRSDIRWGIAGLIAVVVVLVAFGALYLIKFGESTYTAQMTDAAAVRAGDEVRLAGIKVGNVKSLEAKQDHVEMKFSVKDDVFVGAETSIDIRMLTIVGGHYVALVPAGTDPLAGPIPTDRVILPYSLPQIFADAIKPVDEIDGSVLRANLGALQASLQNSPQSLSESLSGVNSIVEVLDTQNADVSRAFGLADEYLEALRVHPEITSGIINSLRLLEDIVIANYVQVGDTLRRLSDVFDRIAPVGRAWDTTLKPIAQGIADSIPPLQELSDRLGALVESVRGLAAKVQPLIAQAGGVTVDQSGSTLPAPALCIPMPGRTC